jgi:hypothetical protein
VRGWLLALGFLVDGCATQQWWLRPDSIISADFRMVLIFRVAPQDMKAGANAHCNLAIQRYPARAAKSTFPIQTPMTGGRIPALARAEPR